MGKQLIRKKKKVIGLEIETNGIYVHEGRSFLLLKFHNYLMIFEYDRSDEIK